ncbi:hypothetical protein B484DRAFT_340416, partial [Ochromonadaceae sp. CCMP2298]
MLATTGGKAAAAAAHQFSRRVLQANSPAPVLQDSCVSILSHNVLLPNSIDGWWCYKMYSSRHRISLQDTLWEARSKLLQAEIGIAKCDVVCIQEVCAESFDSDFAFMASLGY